MRRLAHRFAGAALLLLLSAVISTAAHTTDGHAGLKIVYVDADAPGPIGTGTSWDDAYTSPQVALAVEDGPAEFWVAEGTYKPFGFFGDPRLPSFAIGPGQEVYGGFAGTETARDQRNVGNHRTTLSGDIGVAGPNTDNSYNVVRFLLSGGETAVLDGVTIRGGYDDRAVASGGTAGGIVVSGGQPLLRNIEIFGNVGAQAGALYVGGGSPALVKFLDGGNSRLFNGTLLNTVLHAGGDSISIDQSYFANRAPVDSPVLRFDHVPPAHHQRQSLRPHRERGRQAASPRGRV